MKKGVVITVFLLIVSHMVAQWQIAGVAGFSNAVADYPFIAVNPLTNEPYVVFRDSGHYAKATVMKYNGTNWDTVGNREFSAGIVDCPSMAFDRTGIPYVTYMDWTVGKKITVMKFDGSNWVYLGNPGFSDTAVSYNSIAIDSNGIPYVTFRDVAHDYRASVKKFDGTNWIYVGTPGFSLLGDGNEGALYTSITFDKHNVPYVAYSDFSNSFRATVQKFDGTNWVQVGTPGFKNWNAEYTRSLAFDSNNNPYMVCSVSNKAAVVKFDGNNWVELGTPASAGNTEYASIAIDSKDSIYVAYKDNLNGQRAVVRKFNGTDWLPVGSSGVSAWDVLFTTLAIDRNDNLYLSFSDDNTPHYYETVMKFGNNNTTVLVNAIVNSSDFTIYPNPTTNIFTVCFKGDCPEATINIKNLLGKSIISKKYSFQKELKESFDLSGVGKGVYLVEVIGGGFDKQMRREVKKVVVE